MSRLLRVLALSGICLSALSACDSPLVKGWRDNEHKERSAQEQCEAVKDQQWVNGSCQKKGSLSLDGFGEADCKEVKDALWKDNLCVYFKNLTSAADCASVDWTWQADRCMLPAEATCRLDEATDWVEDHCATRPNLSLAGQTTQALAVGTLFAPVTIELSVSAIASLVAQTCDGFFVMQGNKVTSVAATAGQPICEADVVATHDGAASKPVHLKASIDKGFLSYCTQFMGDDDAVRKDPELAHTVFELVSASEKSTCEEAAKALNAVVYLKLINVGISDLRPLAGLTQIFRLELTDNEGIKDLTPIAYLPNLKVLEMGGTALATEGTVKTEANCPTAAGVAVGVWEFCRKPN